MDEKMIPEVVQSATVKVAVVPVRRSALSCFRRAGRFIERFLPDCGL
jgi:hypothetical protein